MAKTIGQIAALIHKDMCEDAANGYSWSPRWGEDGLGIKTLTIDGRKYKYDCGSYECGTSVTTAWKAVFAGTKYEHALDKYVNTRNLAEVYLSTGLFERKPMSFLACPGDLYLNEANHVAMCQTQEPDVLSEFSWGDNGAYNNVVGDQSGFESSVHGYYSYPWDCIIHAKQITIDELLGKSPKEPAKPKEKADAKVLYGIDVSSNQPEGIVSMVKNDFAIIKMSGNPQRDGEGNPLRWDYVNEFAKRQCADAMRRHGRLGLYHFTWGKAANTEADFFVEQVRKLGYVGKAVLVIDYEAQALSMGRNWVKRFADRVRERTGVAPVIYASGGVIVEQNLKALGYPIWCANYYKGYAPISGYDTSGCHIYAGCEDSVLWQYTSQGHLKGYDGALDCNVFFGTSSDWLKLCAKEKNMDKKPTGYQDGEYAVTLSKVGIRERRSTKSKLCCMAAKGQKLKLTDFRANRLGSVWAEIANGDHKGRFVMVKNPKGVKRLERV